MPDHYAVIGNPVAQSKSPLIHAEFSRQTGQDICYDAILAPVDEFAQAVTDFWKQGGRGLNVTVPFKLEAFRISSRVSERAGTRSYWRGMASSAITRMAPGWCGISRPTCNFLSQASGYC